MDWEKFNLWHRAFDQETALWRKILDRVRIKGKDISNLLIKLREADLGERRCRQEAYDSYM